MSQKDTDICIYCRHTAFLHPVHGQLYWIFPSGLVHTRNHWRSEHKSYHYRMVWFRRDCKDHPVPAPLPWVGRSSTRPGCSKSHPTWPWGLPVMGHPQPSPGNWFQFLANLIIKNFFLIYNTVLLVQEKKISPSNKHKNEIKQISVLATLDFCKRIRFK